MDPSPELRSAVWIFCYKRAWDIISTPYDFLLKQFAQLGKKLQVHWLIEFIPSLTTLLKSPGV